MQLSERSHVENLWCWKSVETVAQHSSNGHHDKQCQCMGQLHSVWTIHQESVVLDLNLLTATASAAATAARPAARHQPPTTAKATAGP